MRRLAEAIAPSIPWPAVDYDASHIDLLELIVAVRVSVSFPVRQIGGGIADGDMAEMLLEDAAAARCRGPLSAYDEAAVEVARYVGQASRLIELGADRQATTYARTLMLVGFYAARLLAVDELRLAAAVKAGSERARALRQAEKDRWQEALGTFALALLLRRPTLSNAQVVDFFNRAHPGVLPPADGPSKHIGRLRRSGDLPARVRFRKVAQAPESRSPTE